MGRAKRPVDATVLEARQRHLFERGSQFFHGRKFAAARRWMARAQAGPDPGLRHRAGVYVAICENRNAKRHARLETVDDHYHRGVHLINCGKLTDAVRVVNRGLAKDPTHGELYYLKCVARALRGNKNLASKDLGRAIEIDSSLRVRARRDPDLQQVIDSPQFAKVFARPHE